MPKRLKSEKRTRMIYNRNFMCEGKKRLNVLESHLCAFHVRKLPTWLTYHGSLLTAAFVLCLILCALSSWALIALYVSLELLAVWHVHMVLDPS